MPVKDTVSYPVTAAPSSLTVYWPAGSNRDPSTRTVRASMAVYRASATAMVPPGSRIVYGLTVSYSMCAATEPGVQAASGSSGSMVKPV